METKIKELEGLFYDGLTLTRKYEKCWFTFVYYYVRVIPILDKMIAIGEELQGKDIPAHIKELIDNAPKVKAKLTEQGTKTGHLF